MQNWDYWQFTTQPERKYASALINVCLAQGFTISVFDSEEWTLSRSADKVAIKKALATTGEDTLEIWHNSERLGFFWLIWGNSGEELIAHYGWQDSNYERMEDIYEMAMAEGEQK